MLPPETVRPTLVKTTEKQVRAHYTNTAHVVNLKQFYAIRQLLAVSYQPSAIAKIRKSKIVGEPEPDEADYLGAGTKFYNFGAFQDNLRARILGAGAERV